MNIVSVDLCTLSAGDINFSALEKLGRVTYYDTLTPGGLAGAAASACFAALIAAGTAFADAADLIWSQTDISLTGSETYEISGVTINDGFTVKIDLSGWQAANGPIGWLTTEAGNGYANSAATFGWGKSSNGAEWHATTFTSKRSLSAAKSSKSAASSATPHFMSMTPRP